LTQVLPGAQPSHARYGSRTAPKRQQTLEATIDWSYDLLSDPERRLLRGLSIFAGRFSLDAVETVCAADGLPRGAIVEHLAQLVPPLPAPHVHDYLGIAPLG